MATLTGMETPLEAKAKGYIQALLVELNLLNYLEPAKDPTDCVLMERAGGYKRSYLFGLNSTSIEIENPDDFGNWFEGMFKAISKSPLLAKKNGQIEDLNKEIERLKKFECYYEMQMELNHGRPE